jgi:hypothetical protein
VTFKKITTTEEVWKAIRAAHPELVPFGGFSDVDGYYSGFRNEASIETTFGFPETDVPILAIKTSWSRDTPDGCRKDEYWLCVGVD